MKFFLCKTFRPPCIFKETVQIKDTLLYWSKYEKIIVFVAFVNVGLFGERSIHPFGGNVLGYGLGQQVSSDGEGSSRSSQVRTTPPFQNNIVSERTYHRSPGTWAFFVTTWSARLEAGEIRSWGHWWNTSICPPHEFANKGTHSPRQWVIKIRSGVINSCAYWTLRLWTCK